jgi:hypothetical protein
MASEFSQKPQCSLQRQGPILGNMLRSVLKVNADIQVGHLYCFVAMQDLMAWNVPVLLERIYPKIGVPLKAYPLRGDIFSRFATFTSNRTDGY